MQERTKHRFWKTEQNTDNVEMNKTNEYVDVHFVVRKRMIVVHTNEVI